MTQSQGHKDTTAGRKWVTGPQKGDASAQEVDQALALRTSQMTPGEELRVNSMKVASTLGRPSGILFHCRCEEVCAAAALDDTPPTQCGEGRGTRQELGRLIQHSSVGQRLAPPVSAERLARLAQESEIRI